MVARTVRVAVASCIVASAFVAQPLRAQTPPELVVDCAGAFNEAGTLRESHRLREARGKYLVCAEPACPSFVRLCVGSAQEVGLAIPSVVFLAQDPAGAPVVDVTVTMDGQPLATNLGGTSLEVDPGKHLFRFVAPGFDEVTREMIVPEGKKDQAETVVLHRSGARPPAPTPLPPVAPLAAPAMTSAAASPEGVVASGGGGRLAGLLVGGAGIVAMGVGAAFAAAASSTWSRAKTECVPGACGTGSPAQSDRSAALTGATLSTTLVVAGGVLTAGGGLLWLLSPGKRPASASAALRISPWLAPSQAGLGVGGAF